MHLLIILPGNVDPDTSGLSRVGFTQMASLAWLCKAEFSKVPPEKIVIYAGEGALVQDSARFLALGLGQSIFETEPVLGDATGSEFGTMEDVEALVARAHQMGLKIAAIIAHEVMVKAIIAYYFVNVGISLSSVPLKEGQAFVFDLDDGQPFGRISYDDSVL
jgi:hypothetical protein